jgi:hypothetical protein
VDINCEYLIDVCAWFPTTAVFFFHMQLTCDSTDAAVAAARLAAFLEEGHLFFAVIYAKSASTFPLLATGSPKQHDNSPCTL